MNRHERRAAAAKAAAAAGHQQQECRCGWLAPREAFVELGYDAGAAPARITMGHPLPRLRAALRPGRRSERERVKAGDVFRVKECHRLRVTACHIDEVSQVAEVLILGEEAEGPTLYTLDELEPIAPCPCWHCTEFEGA